MKNNFIRMLFAAFIGVPVLEIYFLIQVGSIIGALTTVILVVLTAIVGVQLLRLQGFSTLTRAQHSLNAGEIPAMAMLEGVVLLIAGALLLTPGFVTDIFGFLMLVPKLRQTAISYFLRHRSFVFAQDDHSARRSQKTIEGDYWKD